MANETRERALSLHTTPLRETPLTDLMTMTGDLYWLLSLPGDVTNLDRWSRETTLLRARDLVSRAQSEIDRERREAERKREEARSRKRRRR